MKTILIAAVAALISSTAMAADLAGQFASVCKSPAVKSAKLTTACAANQMPDAIKSGDRFKAVGIGAEVNTLAANLTFFTVASK
jgi:hypothetical protein